MGSTAKSNGVPPTQAKSTIKIPATWDSWLGQILPVAVPKAEAYIENLIKQEVADFSAKHPGKSFWEVFGEAIAAKLQDQTLRQDIFDKLHLSGFIAKVSNFSHELLDLVRTDPNLASIKDAANRLDTKALAAQLADGALETAQTVRRELFQADPTATITGIVAADKVTIPNRDPTVKDHTLGVLSKMGPADLATKSPHTILQHKPKLLAHVPAEHRPAVVQNLNALARTQTVSRSPPALEAMMNNGLTSAVAVARTPVAHLRTIMSNDDAVHAKSVANKVVLQNQMLLASLMDRVKTLTPGMIGPSGDRDVRRLRIREVFRARGLNPDLEDLFDSADQPLADENNTVYSPAAYLADLLMYLWNNNLDGKVVPDVSTAGKDNSYKGTALGALFRRRPDLQDLELTPANTTVLLPYIDLVNEVMESFVIHLPNYIQDPAGPSPIDAFNVTTQDSDDLLSQPQNVRMDAYRHLAGAVYPFSLPYHQPINAQRAFLSFLSTSRAEVVDTFRPKPSLKTLEALATRAPKSVNGTQLHTSGQLDGDKKALERLQARALNAQYFCEILGLVQEEFLLLTKGVFWEKEFFEITQGLPPMDDEQYRRRVGLKSTLQCWGYSTAEEMFATNNDAKAGLSFIKAQLLPRSGLSYTELTDIVTTSFLNPSQATGRDKVAFKSLRYSYKFLQELVDDNGSARYDRMAEFVASHTSELNLQALFNHSSLGTSSAASSDTFVKDELKTWIVNNFKRIGNIVVIDAGEGPRLKINGRIVARIHAASGLPVSSSVMAELASDGRILQGPTTELSQAPIATLLDDGSILDSGGKRMGQVGLNYRVYYKNPLNDNDFNSAFPKLDFFIENHPSWVITGGKLSNSAADVGDSKGFNKIWELDENMGGSGSIDNARLMHLDGSPLSLVEWDRLHRFVRLWRKLGWSAADTDRAVCFLLRSAGASPSEDQNSAQIPQADSQTWDHDSRPFDYQRPVNFEDFEDDSSSGSSQGPSGPPQPDITYALIEQLAAVKQIQGKTSLSVEDLLTFFCPMTSQGPKSQYSRLFLTRQLRASSSVFESDTSGVYFTGTPSATIRQHISAIAAAISMKQDDILFLITPQKRFPRDWTVSDILSMANITRLYRYALLARTLSVKVTDLFQIMAGFGDPFVTPTAFSKLLDEWRKMADAGFPWEELRYVVDQIPTPADPLALTEFDSLNVANTLRQKMIDIHTTYPLDLPQDKKTPEYTNTTASLLLPASTVTGIMGLLLGTTVYSAPGPVVSDSTFNALVKQCSNNAATYTVPATQGDLKPKAILQITGIIDQATKKRLVAAVKNAAIASDHDTVVEVQKAWETSVDQVCQKAFSSFRELMYGILPTTVLENELNGNDQVLLAADPVPPPATAQQPPKSSTTSSSATPAAAKVNPKIERFLRYYIPFLQARLTYNSVLETMAAATSFTNMDVARTYLENVISIPSQSRSEVKNSAGSSGPAITHESAIAYITRFISDSLATWVGYLKFDVAGDYIFSIQGFADPPEPFELKPIFDTPGGDVISSALGSGGLFGVSLPEDDRSDSGSAHVVSFKPGLGGPPGLWVTDPVPIVSGTQYLLSIKFIEKSKLRWQTASINVQPIPDDRYLPVWKGYIRPATTDVYQFYAKDLGLPVGQSTPSGSVTLDGKLRVWDGTVESDSDTFYALKKEAQESRLEASKLHSLELTGISPDQLCWKTMTTALESVPASSFLPAATPDRIYGILTKLQKLALFSNHFALSSEEILYIHQNSKTFTDLPDFEASFEDLEANSEDPLAEQVPTINLDGIHALRGCTRLYDYTKLRDRMPQNTTWPLIELFAWSSQHLQSSGAELARKIHYATSWPERQILSLLENSNFSTGLEGSASDFCNERLLLRLEAQRKLAQRMAVSPETLFIWASPLGTAPRDFYAYNTVSQAIQHNARSRFSPADWTTAVRPINNLLRENQRAALVSYLLVQQKFVRENNIVDADSLFEFFLIDVQMKPLVETSRIIQATATVQLFVQRCMLGMEEPFVVTKALDRQRWAWMQNFRVWQANRQIFLYPENWIVPSLRDDKSEIFKVFESDLLQNNLSKDTTSTALRNYVYNLANLANLEAMGLYVDNHGTNDVHVFAHTRTSPFTYYYNCFHVMQDQVGQWDSWQDMKIQIPTVVDPQTKNTGVFLAPIVFQGRLILFVPEITQQTAVRSTGDQSFELMAKGSTQSNAAQKVWEFRMSWTEYRNGSWMPRQTCPQPYRDLPENQDVGSYFLTPCLIWKDGKSTTASGQETPPSSVAVHLAMTATSPTILAGWTFDGRQLSCMSQDSVKPLNFKVTMTENRVFQILRPISVVPPGPATPSAPVQSTGPAAFFSLQGSNINPSTLSNAPDPTVWMDGVHQFVEDADSYDQFLTASNATSVAIDLRGPSIMPTVANVGPSQTQRFFHGFIHDLVRAVTTSSDVSALFDILGAVGQGSQTGATGADNVDFREAFGAIALTVHPQTLPRPPTKIGTAVPPAANGTTPVVNGVAPAAADTAGQPTDPAATTVTNAPAQADAQGVVQFNQRSKVYSLYNWELGMHACMTLMDSLFKAQQFEQARDVAHYVFDPFASGDKGDPSRFWKFPPFKVASVATIESLFLELEAGERNDAINDWRDHPFQPHVVARSRPEAYMKWIVMTYIKILIGWGDSLFSQNTLESIPQAIQLYVMASHIYGPRGQVVRQRTEITPQTFRTLSKKFDAFSNAMVQLEEVFPFSNQMPLPVGKLPLDNDDHLPNVFGFAGTLYFAIPDNPSIRQLAATIDDRLFKIRNSEDINGNFRILPLLAPPIDPALLVQAQAQGLSLSSVLQDLQGPLPNCRFEVLLQKAFDVVAEVRALSQSLISIRERHDAEELSLIRQRQDASLQNSAMDIKTMNLQDAQNSIEVLNYNRTAAVSRLGFWFKLVGNDLSGIPALDQDFQELDAKITAPVTSGGLALSDFEQAYLDKSSDAQDLTYTAGQLDAAAAALRAIPDVQVNTQPLGLGESASIGPNLIMAPMEARARGLNREAQLLQSQGTSASTLGAHQRALQERILQANTAGHEISSIDKQITGAQVRVALAKREIEVQQQEINNSQQITNYLTSKYSAVELYSWLDSQTKTLAYQTYTTALSLAKRVEKAFKYERPQEANTTYINAGYWDATKSGLFAAENLYLSLKTLEAAHLNTQGHDYEITKTVSLRSLDPLALTHLRTLATCDFSIPEVLYDMDFPGHYLRRLKSVSVTIPCVVGPTTAVNGTLRLLASEYRISPDLTPSYAKDLTTSSSGVDPRFALASPPVSAIAVCAASADAGVFTLDFGGGGGGSQRYLPFEGAGAVSSWRLSLPGSVRQFDYESIFDVVVQLRYTSLEGGVRLADAADSAVQAYMKRAEEYAASAGFGVVLDLKREWAGAWAKAAGGGGAGKDGDVVKVELGDVRPRLPFFTVGKKVNVSRLHLLVDQELGTGGTVSVDLGSGGNDGTVKLDQALTDLLPLQHYASAAGGKGVPFGGQWVVHLGQKDLVKAVTKCVLLIEYVLAS